MARIYFSALVNRIAGRVSYSVLSVWKGIAVIKRHNAGVHQPRTVKQQEVRGNFSDIAGEYYALEDVEKELWQAHASMLPDAMTALNAYLKYNMRLERYLPGTARMESPPKTPDTPEHPVAVSVSSVGSGDFCVEWTNTIPATVYAIVDIWAMPGRDLVTHPRWTFGASASGDTKECLVSTSYPTDTIVKFRVRTMDASGRVSPWSVALSLAAE